ncbi:MAG: hypothetical protein JWL83_1323 [Actinomycetia bacterium]|nr:hypothetical protein [Actinomycetes bacterium]
MSALDHELAGRGIVELVDVFTDDFVTSWNFALDVLFAATGEQARSYVGADVLAELGLLGSLFTPKVRAVLNAIYGAEPIVLYHCHVYEIEGGQRHPHIQRRQLDGWHRDIETLEHFRLDEPEYVSIFTYLTDVGDDGGPFEFVPQPPLRHPTTGSPCVTVVGPAGFTFAWNRSYFHRAAPNRSPERRRVLKLSVQPARLPHDRLDGVEFRRAREMTTGDSFVHGLFGGDTRGDRTELSIVDTPYRPLIPNRSVDVSGGDVAAYNALRAGRYLRRRARAFNARTRPS